MQLSSSHGTRHHAMVHVLHAVCCLGFGTSFRSMHMPVRLEWEFPVSAARWSGHGRWCLQPHTYLPV